MDRPDDALSETGPLAPPFAERDVPEAKLVRLRLEEVAAESAVARSEGSLPDLEPLRHLVDQLRRASRSDDPARGCAFAVAWLEHDAALRTGVVKYCGQVVMALRMSGALAELGVFPAHGLSTEVRERIVQKVLPSHRPPSDLSEALGSVFDRRASLWLASMTPAQIEPLLTLLTPDDTRARNTCELGVLGAIDLLAHRTAAAGEDPILHHFDPTALDYDSPFLAQATEVLALTANRRKQLADGTPILAEDIAHARVLLRQCREAVAGIRKRTPRTGATVRLGYELARIRDMLARSTLLLSALGPSGPEAALARADLLRTIVSAQDDGEHVGPLVARASQLVANEVVSQAGRTGEHYITRTAREYGRMWAAAAGAGAIVAMLAVVKVRMAVMHAPLLVEAAMFSANYAVGFVLVQSLGLTIATKQPAMTAAALASGLDGERRREHRPLVETMMCLTRSQLAAILGNCLVALPAAFFYGMLGQWLLGGPVAPTEKATVMLREVDPLASLAVPHAALTGCWLTISGIVAGFVANSVVARHVPLRISSSVPLRRWFGERGVERLSRWSRTSAGAWMGSIVLGILLGSTGTFGKMLGLPLDIRHVSFASANVGLASATVGLANVDWPRMVAGIALIGAANLSVSFGLSLALALHARGRTLREMPGLARELLRSVAKELPAWLLPIGKTAQPLASAAESSHNGLVIDRVNAP